MKAPAFVRLRLVAPMAAIALLSGCESVMGPAPRGPGAAGAPSLGLFSHIKVPDGFEPAFRLAGRGVQIFRCEAIGGEYLWRFRQPEAELTDEGGQLVARHGANFTFEHRDGSRLAATITAYDEASKRDDLRWLLMSAKSFGKGAFTPIAYIQRVNTSGGMPPASCQATDVNHLLRVNFTADFFFYRARP
jgi:hypothetical protein